MSATNSPTSPASQNSGGHGVYHCPYCHGWEARDQRLGVFASGEDAMHLAPLVHNWSPNVTVLSHGPAGLDDRQRAILNRIGIAVCESPIARLIVEGGSLAGVLFEDGRDIPLDGIFTRTQIRPHNALAKELGCDLIGEGLIAGLIQVDQRGQTSVPGVYAAGDIATLLQQVVTAAASGATVAAMINHALVEQTVHAALAG